MNNIFCIILLFRVFNLNLCLNFEYSPFTVILYDNLQSQLSCSPFANPANVKWIKYSFNLIPRELKNDNFHKINSNGSLDVKHLPENRAYYHCISIYEKQFIIEKFFQIIKIENSSNFRLFYSKNNVLKLKNDLIFISELNPKNRNSNCDLIWLMWRNDGFYNVSRFNGVVISGNRLSIKTVPLNNDLSFFTCLVHPDSNRIFNCGNFHFIRFARLDVHLKILYAQIKDGVMLKCGDVNVKEYQWFKNGKPIKFDQRLENYGNRIFIKNLTEDDFGHYDCLSEKPFLLPYKLSIFLVNFYNSSNLFQSLITKIKQDSIFTLPCKNLSTKFPKQIFGNLQLTPRLFDISNLKNSVLNLNIISNDFPEKNIGFYQCFVNYQNKLNVLSYHFLVENKDYNKLSKSLVLKKRSAEESNFIFNYSSTSNSIKIIWAPPVVPVKSYTIQWGNMYPGPIKQVISGDETKFVIESLKPDTNYFIKIDISGNKGINYKASIHQVMTKKENKEIVLQIPVNLKVVEVGDTWAKISWDYRENGDSLNKTVFQVEYYPSKAHPGNKINTNISTTHINIRNLNPATGHEIIVRSCLINSSKCSDWSMVLDFTTLETSPGDAPQQLTLSTVHFKNVPPDNPSNQPRFAVQVSWQPPTKPNGEIKNYLISFSSDKKIDMNSWGERTISGKALNTVIDRLDLDRYYYFRISCSNDHGKSPFSPIKIFKTPDKNGKNVGPVTLSKEYYDPMDIQEELKIITSNERGNDNLNEEIVNNNETGSKKPDKVVLTNYKWWIIIGIVVGAILVFVLIILFLVASKCRNENSLYGSDSKNYSKKLSDRDYRTKPNEVVKFVNKGPILTTPDLFRHTNDQNCHQNYMEMEERTESPNSFSSNKGFPSQNHNPTFSNQQNFRGIPGHYTPPGLIHQQNIVMTTSQLTSNSNERQFYQVPFLHHMSHNPINVFTSSAPRVNAAASDFNSINIPSPISGYSDFTSSQATVLYDTSTAKSSGGKSSLSGSGSYNNGLANKNSLVNEPINECFNNSDNNPETKNMKSNEQQLLSAFSSEELSVEMANLEGLMKDLNSITQKEFEC